MCYTCNRMKKVREVINISLKTVQQVAEELGMHPETVRKKIRDGDLKAYHTGKSYRISEEQLVDFLEAGSTSNK